jgi:hypothetical protein
MSVDLELEEQKWLCRLALMIMYHICLSQTALDQWVSLVQCERKNCASLKRLCDIIVKLLNSEATLPGFSLSLLLTDYMTMNSSLSPCTP